MFVALSVVVGVGVMAVIDESFVVCVSNAAETVLDGLSAQV